MSKLRYQLALVLFAIAAAPASADIYRFVDADGKVHFTDVRVDKRYELIMKTTPPAAAQPAPAALAGSDPARTSRRTAHAHKPYADIIAQVAREHQMDPALIHAVVAVESAYNPRARSRAGATGLMQLMPDTARRYGVSDRLNPLENVRGGTRYLRDLLAMFNNNMRLAIAAYNAGEGAVMRSGNRIPPYAETRAYVPRVLQHYERNRARES